MKGQREAAILIEQAVEGLFRDALRLIPNDPSHAYFFLRAIGWQKRAAQLRLKWQATGYQVPLAMMMSLTDRCNLRCRGCFAQAHQSAPREEMDEGKVRSILAEAKELGISIILLIGGEPLIRQEILNATRDFPEIIFLLFSNGLLIDENLLPKFKERKNVVPILSMEGYQEETDGRRGKGVYQYLKGLIPQMEKANIFWGLSFTLTKLNFYTVTDVQFYKRAG